jgi:hypothetical protein
MIIGGNCFIKAGWHPHHSQKEAITKKYLLKMTGKFNLGGNLLLPPL